MLQHCEGSQRHADDTSWHPFFIFRNQSGFDRSSGIHSGRGMHRKHESDKLRTTTLLRKKVRELHSACVQVRSA